MDMFRLNKYINLIKMNQRWSYKEMIHIPTSQAVGCGGSRPAIGETEKAKNGKLKLNASGVSFRK